ncbi:MAG: putative rhamnosyl transferase [Cyclobacteriaceae bacterium]|nr:putative rhamnosyl transferase [Cyclobacteriaceae bacterium]
MTTSEKNSLAHVLVTQFNLKRVTGAKSTTDEEWITWTHDRLRLFKTYCLPSVLGQTQQDFLWFLFFDSTTPARFDAELAALRQIPCVRLRFCAGIDDFDKRYASQIRAEVPAHVPWLVSTRLDNDDVLHREAVALIRRTLILQHGYMVSLAHGYVWDITRQKMARYYYPKSPFLTRVERNTAEATGIFHKLHTQWPQLQFSLMNEVFIRLKWRPVPPFNFVLTGPAWIQLVHGNNISNNFFRGVPVCRVVDLRSFQVDGVNRPAHFWEVFQFRNYVLWKWFLKCALLRIFFGDRS